MRQLKRGDWVVYRKQKTSTSPGPRAKEVTAARRGDNYSYVVDKFWVVKQSLGDNQLVLVTRAGKQHAVLIDDPNLRLASWWERWIYKQRFQETEERVKNSVQGPDATSACIKQ